MKREAFDASLTILGFNKSHVLFTDLWEWEHPDGMVVFEKQFTQTRRNMLIGWVQPDRRDWHVRGYAKTLKRVTELLEEYKEAI